MHARDVSIYHQPVAQQVRKGQFNTIHYQYLVYAVMLLVFDSQNFSIVGADGLINQLADLVSCLP